MQEVTDAILTLCDTRITFFAVDLHEVEEVIFTRLSSTDSVRKCKVEDGEILPIKDEDGLENIEIGDDEEIMAGIMQTEHEISKVRIY